MKKENIVLIGMPSAGKSTVGKFLAEKMAMEFVDTDSIIFEKAKKPLKDIVSCDGLQKFLEIQQDVVHSLNVSSSVIATGGSVVYSTGAMNDLKKNGKIIFLKQSYDEIVKRIASGRRFARKEEQNFLDLYNERMPLYKKYADVIIECLDKKVEEIAAEIEKIIRSECEGDV